MLIPEVRAISTGMFKDYVNKPPVLSYSYDITVSGCRGIVV